MSISLEARHTDEIARRVVELLSRARLEAPLRQETEEAYTSRVLRPAVEGLVRELGLPGLVVKGDGGVLPDRAFYAGAYFRPDIAVTRHGARLVAVEVKLASSHGYQNSIATAIGQALVYSVDYAHAVALVIDVTGRGQPGCEDLGHSCVAAIVRGKDGKCLVPVSS